ncbi:MAG: HEAT repeat domain-containing protein [Candidatus Latescibacterota bacterium]|nr:HEAT repeat domain-containing protein [Candidatus Latescibacterota bacterium]
MPKVKSLNKHQKRAKEMGEKRVRGDEIWAYVELSKSGDPEDRLEAAKNLCPCHVKRRIDEVWDALYRMMEDSNVAVRRAAYHTLEDGGKLVDPELRAIFTRARAVETDRQVLGFLKEFDAGKDKRERVEMNATMVSKYVVKGKCDFCGETNVSVRTDFNTEIPDGGSRRLALLCKTCDR